MRRADPHRRQRVAAGVAAAGVPYAFLAVVPDAVARAVPDAAALRASSRDVGGAAGGLVGFVVVVAFDRHGRHAHTRMFAPEVGVVEDPATGSAAVALGVLLVDRGVLAGDGPTGFTVDQGAEIGRPSRLAVLVRARDGAAVGTAVRGDVTTVARGEPAALPAP